VNVGIDFSITNILIEFSYPIVERMI
jgi:hypothetical protein